VGRLHSSREGDSVTVGSRSGSQGGVGWPGVVTALGAIGVVFTFGIAGSAEWGPPGTPAYNTYQTLNRLVTIPAMMLVLGVAASGWRARNRLGVLGWLAWFTALSGSLLILVGNVGEFWVFTSRSYSDSARNVSWGLFVLGGLLLVVGGILAIVRSGVRPHDH
jgi:hypothetical protein